MMFLIHGTPEPPQDLQDHLQDLQDHLQDLQEHLQDLFQGGFKGI